MKLAIMSDSHDHIWRLDLALTLMADADRLIRQAGSAEEDAARLEILKRLQAVPGLDPRQGDPAAAFRGAGGEAQDG